MKYVESNKCGQVLGQKRSKWHDVIHNVLMTREKANGASEAQPDKIAAARPNGKDVGPFRRFRQFASATADADLNAVGAGRRSTRSTAAQASHAASGRRPWQPRKGGGPGLMHVA